MVDMHVFFYKRNAYFDNRKIFFNSSILHVPRLAAVLFFHGALSLMLFFFTHMYFLVYF